MHGYGISQKLAALSHDTFHGQSGIAVPLAVPPRAGWQAESRMAAHREQSQGEVLPAHGVRAEAARTAAGSAGTGSRLPSRVCWRAHDVPASARVGAALGCSIGTGPSRAWTTSSRHSSTCPRPRRCATGCRPRRRAAWRFSSSAASNRPRNASAPTVTAPGWTRSGRDVRYAFRMFVKNPGFTGIIVLTLALGIGANTAIFSLIDALMLRWLPVRNPQELVQLTLQAPGAKRPRWRELLLRQSSARSPISDEIFAGVAGFSALHASTSALPVPSARVPGAMVTGGYFETLGLTPALGRLLTREDDHARRAAGGRGQLRLLGAATRAQPRSGRPDRADQRRSRDGRRRQPSRIRRRQRGLDCRHHDGGRRSSPSEPERGAAAGSRQLLAARPREAQAGRVDSAGDGASQRRVAADIRAGDCAALASEPAKGHGGFGVSIEPRRHRLDLPAGGLPEAAARADGRRRVGAAHRVRQCREPAAGARRRRASERSRCAWPSAPAAPESCASC